MLVQKSWPTGGGRGGRPKGGGHHRWPKMMPEDARQGDPLSSSLSSGRSCPSHIWLGLGARPAAGAGVAAAGAAMAAAFGASAFSGAEMTGGAFCHWRHCLLCRRALWGFGDEEDRKESELYKPLPGCILYCAYLD